MSLRLSHRCTRALPAVNSAKAQSSTRLRAARGKPPFADHNSLAGLSRSTYISRKTGHCASKVRHQSRNVYWNQSDAGIFEKITTMTRTGLRKCCLVGVRHPYEFRTSQTISSLHILATLQKRRKKKNISETPPQNVALFKINNILGTCRLGPKPESSLESAKRRLRCIIS